MACRWQSWTSTQVFLGNTGISASQMGLFICSCKTMMVCFRFMHLHVEIKIESCM